MLMVSILGLVLWTVLTIEFIRGVAIHKYDMDDVIQSILALSFIVIVGFFTVSLYEAAMVAPNLSSSRAKAIALKSEIARVRRAYYLQINKGKFIGGSLDNLKQSTNLSLYIANYAKAKAKYNAYLAKEKTICNTTLFWIVGSNIATNCPAIENMKPIIQ